MLFNTYAYRHLQHTPSNVRRWETIFQSDDIEYIPSGDDWIVMKMSVTCSYSKQRFVLLICTLVVLTRLRAVSDHTNPRVPLARKMPRMFAGLTANHCRLPVSLVPGVGRGSDVRAATDWRHGIRHKFSAMCKMCISGCVPLWSTRKKTYWTASTSKNNLLICNILCVGSAINTYTNEHTHSKNLHVRKYKVINYDHQRYPICQSRSYTISTNVSLTQACWLHYV